MIKQVALSALGAMGVAHQAFSQQLPPIRQLGPVTAASAEPLGGFVTLRDVAKGVLVNDVQNRRLLFFDPTLAKFTVVADTTPATASAYGGRVGSLFAFHGDSSLFVDPQSQSMTVVDPNGQLQRVMALPRSQDAMTLGNAVFGTPAFDAGGRLVYRAAPDMRAMMARAQMGPNGTFMPPEPPDTMPLVRIDLATRALDTVGFMKVPKIKMDVQRDENGRVRMQSIANPLPVVDDWAVLADGSIALLRGRDYHVDWVRPNGTRESSPKMPFEWQRLSDDDKVAFLDSVKAARQRMAAADSVNRRGAPGGVAGGGAAGGPPGGGGGQQIVIMGGPGGGGGPPGGMMGGPGREMAFVAPSELPDYKPAFFAGSARADADGFLWVRTIPTKGIAGGPVYDVIDGKGALVDRVQVPKDRIIAGFGKGGVVYLLAREGTVSKLERAKAR